MEKEMEDKRREEQSVNVKKIKSLMGENDHTKTYVSSILKITPPALKKKLEGKVEFKASE